MEHLLVELEWNLVLLQIKIAVAEMAVMEPTALAEAAEAAEITELVQDLMEADKVDLVCLTLLTDKAVLQELMELVAVAEDALMVQLLESVDQVPA
jgi:predicted ATP-grasp superfamily ATP-dependent carboligase